jgi:hypothetical protein
MLFEDGVGFCPWHKRDSSFYVVHPPQTTPHPTSAIGRPQDGGCAEASRWTPRRRPCRRPTRVASRCDLSASRYDLACLYARASTDGRLGVAAAGRKSLFDTAFEHLRHFVARVPSGAEWARRNPELEPLRGNTIGPSPRKRAKRGRWGVDRQGSSRRAGAQFRAVAGPGRGARSGDYGAGGASQDRAHSEDPPAKTGVGVHGARGRHRDGGDSTVIQRRASLDAGNEGFVVNPAGAARTCSSGHPVLLVGPPPTPRPPYWARG